MAIRLILRVILCCLAVSSFHSQAEDALCAEVKIEILQELTMERQGFEALMKITNSLELFRWKMSV